MTDQPPPAIVLNIPAPAPVDEARMLWALVQVENWDGRTAGRSGEWGPLQIKPATWRQFSKVPQRRATVEEVQRVALCHLRNCTDGLRRTGLPVTPYWVALVWRAGLRNLQRHTVKREWRNYAERAENCYNR